MVRAGGGQINEQKEVIITEATAKHRSGASKKSVGRIVLPHEVHEGFLTPFLVGRERMRIPMEERRAQKENKMAASGQHLS